MNPKRFNDIVSWMSSDRPDTPDLSVLDVNVSPSLVAAGSSLSSMNYVIHNYSDATWSGSISVRNYLSDNDYISKSDTLLLTASVSATISPRGRTNVTVTSPPSTPAGTAPGESWVGMILNVSDADASNNDSDGWDAAKIEVPPEIEIREVRPQPTWLQPSDGSYANDRPPTFSWTQDSRSPSFYVRLAPRLPGGCDWSSGPLLQVGSAAWFRPSNDLADGSYCWSPQGYNNARDCDVKGEWSDSRILTVDAAKPTNPTEIGSTSRSLARWSNDGTVDMHWTRGSDATSGVWGYSVLWCKDSESRGPDEVIDTEGTGATSSLLDGGH